MSETTARNSAGYETPYGLTADPVIFTISDGHLALLLARRRSEPYQEQWALPGGFVGAGETSRAVAVRKLAEKTGMPPIYVEQLGFYDEGGRDPRGWLPSVAFLALVPAQLLPAGSDASWHALDALPSLELFGHGRMVADGVARLRGKLWYSNVAMGLLPPKFTMREAAGVYSAIAGRSYDHLSNFTRDLLHTGLVRATGEKLSDVGPGRPAELFEFVSHRPEWSPAYGKGTLASSATE